MSEPTSNFSWLQGYEPFYTWAIQAEVLLSFDHDACLCKLRLIAERLMGVPWGDRVDRIWGRIWGLGSRAAHGDSFTYDDALRHLKDCRSGLLAYYRSASNRPDFVPPRFECPATLIEIGRAEWRNLISERTKTALQHKKAQGARLGQRPYSNEAGLKRLRELANQGLSRSAIARQLNLEGIPALRGGQWLHTNVASVLSRLG